MRKINQSHLWVLTSSLYRITFLQRLGEWMNVLKVEILINYLVLRNVRDKLEVICVSNFKIRLWLDKRSSNDNKKIIFLGSFFFATP